MNLNTLHAFLADAATPASGAGAAPAGGSTAPNQTAQMLNMVILFGGIFLLFYMLTIRPQNKRNKELAARLATLKPGDKVVTSSGIVGTVIAVKDRTISMRSADTKLEVLKSTVSDITERASEASAAAE